MNDKIIIMPFCPECGNENSTEQRFCAQCGTNLKSDTNIQSNPNITQPVMNQSQSNPQPPHTGYQYSNPRMMTGTNLNYGSQRPDYIRPQDYVFTKSIGERIMGTLKRDIHVVEEIEEREDLNDEALKLLIVNFSLISLFYIIGVFIFPQYYILINPLGTVVEVILTTFISGFLYIQFIASIGKSIGGQDTDTSNEEMRRVLSYAYVAFVIEGLLSVITDMTGEVILTILWFVSLLYAFFVFIFAVRRALDKGFGTALVTVIIAYVGKIFIEFIILLVVFFIFGDTYFPIY